MFRCYTVQDVKDKLPEWRKNVENDFRPFYRFVFNFATPSKKLRPATAVSLWKLILNKQSESANGKELLQYFSTVVKQPVTRDIWNEVYDFLESMQPGFTNYDFSAGCWNSVLDEFLEWRNSKK
jgi:hypothetical protein